LANKGYNSNFIEELKSKCNIVSVISKYVTLQKKGKTYWACCPFHHEKTPSFAVNENEQFYHCYGCGESGDLIKFVQKYENMSFVEAVKFIAKENNIELPELESNDDELQKLRQKEKVLKALNMARDFYKENLKLENAKVAKEYLLKREIDDNTAQYFDIGVSLDWNGLVNFLRSKGVSDDTMKSAGLVDTNSYGNLYDFFGTRLIFPIKNVYGDTIGFTARTLDKDPKFAKYKNSSQTIVFDKSKTIYNISTIKELKKEKLDYIIICEGTIDVIAMFKSGFKNTVACLGTAITNAHAYELKRFCDKIVLCLDGDSAGQHAMYKSIDILLDEDLEVKVAQLKDNLDPDEFIKKYGADEMRKCLDSSVDAIEYKIVSLSKNFKLEDSYQKSKYTKQALEIIDKLNTSAEKEIYLKLLSRLVNISVDVLRKDLSQNVLSTSQNISNEKQEYVVRPDGLFKASEYVLASIIHKKDFAEKALDMTIKFQNPSYQNLFEFAKRVRQENKTYTISSLFDYFEVDENNDIKKIIDFDFQKILEPSVYFDECLSKIVLTKLKEEQENLTKEFKNTVDLEKRREIAMKLNNITKEIKKQNGVRTNV